MANRAGTGGPLMLLVKWKRPMLAAAALIAMVSAGVLWQVESTEVEENETGVAEAIGVPTLLAQGLRSNEMPTMAELFEAFRGIQ